MNRQVNSLPPPQMFPPNNVASVGKMALGRSAFGRMSWHCLFCLFLLLAIVGETWFHFLTLSFIVVQRQDILHNDTQHNDT